MSIDNNLVVPAGQPVLVGGMYLLQADGSAARQGDQSTCLASIARGAVRAAEATVAPVATVEAAPSTSPEATTPAKRKA